MNESKKDESDRLTVLRSAIFLVAVAIGRAGK